ncbi:hypothetical protein V8F33_006453 [Rhypophila sp. PSN 637]
MKLNIIRTALLTLFAVTIPAVVVNAECKDDKGGRGHPKEPIWWLKQALVASSELEKYGWIEPDKGWFISGRPGSSTDPAKGGDGPACVDLGVTNLSKSKVKISSQYALNHWLKEFSRCKDGGVAKTEDGSLEFSLSNVPVAAASPRLGFARTFGARWMIVLLACVCCAGCRAANKQLGGLSSVLCQTTQGNVWDLLLVMGHSHVVRRDMYAARVVQAKHGRPSGSSTTCNGLKRKLSKIDSLWMQTLTAAEIFDQRQVENPDIEIVDALVALLEALQRARHGRRFP